MLRSKVWKSELNNSNLTKECDCIPAPFLVSIIALFVGTVAIGGFIGFLVALVVSKIKNKK